MILNTKPHSGIGQVQSFTKWDRIMAAEYSGINALHTSKKVDELQYVIFYCTVLSNNGGILVPDESNPLCVVLETG